MGNTKENILIHAVKLFAVHGYKGTSMSDIAAVLGISKAALYKHYKSKQEIMDCIVERMKQKDAERMRQYHMPEGSFEEMASNYNQMPIDQIKVFSEAQFRYWTEDEFAREFRQILTLEQYRSEELRQLFQVYLVTGPVDYMTQLFAEMLKQANHSEVNAKALVLEFYGPIYLLIDMYDMTENKEELVTLLREHISSFEKKMEEYI